MDSRYPWLDLNLRDKAHHISKLSMMLPVSFSEMAFLNHERVLGFTKCFFYTNLYDHRTFLLPCVALVDYIKWFPNVEPICIPRIKLTCPWCITFLCCILLKIFVLNFIRNAGIQFYFLYCICLVLASG